NSRLQLYLHDALPISDVASLYWAAMPGNAADFSSEESLFTFIEPALCFFTEETNDHDSPSPFGIKMADRLTGRPIHLDISDLPIDRKTTRLNSSHVKI